MKESQARVESARAMPTLQTSDQNKALVRDFYARAFVRKEPEAAAKSFLGDRYTQHNPSAADGADAFVAFAKGLIGASPTLKVEIKRVIAEANLVVVHSRFETAPGKASAVMDIFRVEGGRIVEHWDVSQDVPATAANENTMF